MLVYVRGAGDIATGVAARLVRAGVSVVMADIAVPTCIRRTISFCEAIRLGEVEVEGIRARLAQTPAEALAITEAGDVAVVVDPQAKMLGELKPAAVVDAILAKRNLGTTRDMAPAVIAVGPGFTAPVDCDAVVETMRGHFLGRVITQGSPQPNTGVPGIIAGYGKERVIHSPAAGVFRSDHAIGDIVSAGDVIGYAGDTPMCTQIAGCLRGLLANGVQVTEGFKCADVDPRGDARYQSREGAASLLRGADVEIHQFVGPFGGVFRPQLHRVADVAQPDEVDALDGLSLADVEAGDYAFGKHLFSSSRVIRPS